MPEGSPEDYEAAKAAEMADVELDYPGRGNLDLHVAAENTLQIGARFAEVIEDAQPGLEEEMAARAIRIEAAHRRLDGIKRVAANAGKSVMRGLSVVGASYVASHPRLPLR